MTPYEANKLCLSSGKPPLMLAVHLIEILADKHKHSEDRQRLGEIIRALLDARAHPNTPDVNGQRLQISEYIPLSLSRAFIDLGLDLQAQNLAAVRTQQTMQLLLVRKADPNQIDPDIDRAPVRKPDSKPIEFLRAWWRSRLMSALRCVDFLSDSVICTIASFIVFSAEEAAADITTYQRACDVCAFLLSLQLTLCCSAAFRVLQPQRTRAAPNMDASQ